MIGTTTPSSDEVHKPPQPSVIHVPLDKILPLVNDRKDRTTRAYFDHETAVMADIIAAGVRTPVKGYWTPERMFQLVCGQTRVYATRRAGKDHVPAIPLHGEINESRLLIEELTDNNMTEGFDLLALGGIYIDLMRVKGWTQTELCANVPAAKPGTVSRALSVFEDLIEELKSRLRAGDIGPRVGYALSRLPKEKQQEAYQKVAGMKVESAEARIAEMRGRKPRKVQPIKLTVKGVTAIIGTEDMDTADTGLTTLLNAIRKCKKDGYSISSVPQLLKNPPQG